ELLGDLYHQCGLRDRVERSKYFTSALEKYQKAGEYHKADPLLPFVPATLLSKEGDVRMDLGQYPEAQDLYQQVLASARLASGTVEATIKLGRSLLRQGKFSESAKVLERQLEGSVLTEQQESRACYLLGDAYYESKRYDMMMEAYGRALRLEEYVAADEDIDPMRAHMRMTNFLYLAQGKYKEAVAQYEEILKKYPQGRYRFRTIYYLGQAYSAMNNLNEAARYFTMLIGENPELRYVDPAFLKDAYFKLGRIHFQKKDYPKAIKAYEALMERYPDDPLVPSILERQGDCYAQLALYAKAEEVYLQVLDNFPESSNWSLTALKAGQLKENLSEFAAASEFYARIKRRDPSDPLCTESEYRRLEMELRMAQTEPGVAAERRFASVLRDAVQAQSEYPDEIRFYAQQGVAAYSLKDFSTAADAFVKYLDQSGDLERIPRCTFLLGDALLQLERHQEAADILQKRIEMEGDDDERAHALFLLAVCQKKLNEFDKAIVTLNELLTSHPSSSFIPEASAEKSRLEWSSRNVGYLQGTSQAP
ncbi:MAG TPA: tetratricopeptide repeat protein, partial [bacterium]|nr:tetratricopeptide repeat protein [bacterium]